MKKIARISTAAFLAGATTLAVTLPMPQNANAQGAAQSTRNAEQPARLPKEGEAD
ncbi:hypothetical protein [Frigidibacter sp. ROC022]|uniref:hypothetical protein n=1 Tax=Frigidibacter sp. ROC022 TaxID=2971796 RepID=UPI00215AB424|nr:hypothetical protein [Frigidibacter sp. ROC022]MCR8723785.1 hypothetical protein [Frigidibacter sp. ROC022]